MHAHVALGLEDAAEVRRHDGERSGEEPFRDLHVDTPRPEPPPLDERLEHVAVEPDPPAFEALVVRDLDPLVPGHRREHTVERFAHPGVLVLVDGDRLDRERAGSRVLPDGAVGLQPADERRLRHLDEVDLAVTERVPAVPLQLVAGTELRCRNEPACSDPLRSPHEVIAGHLELVSGLRVDPQDLLHTVGLGRHDARDPAGVVDLRADPVLLDELPDGDQTVGGADERAVRLARAALLRRVGDADVEPHRRVERRLLIDEQVRELVGEDLGVLLRGEVSVLLAPAADRVDDAGDELADRGLALGRAERTTEVLLGDDVGGVLRPADGELNAALLEGVPAFLEVGDDRVTRLPFDLVERVGPLRREVPS